MYNGALNPVSNRASWIDCWEVLDQETGEPIDLTGSQEIVMQVVSLLYDQFFRFDYGFGVGGVVGALMITATLTNGQIVIIQPGVFQVTFPRSMMNTLTPGDYNVGVTIVKDDITTEVFIGQVPILAGVVTIQAGSN